MIRFTSILLTLITSLFLSIDCTASDLNIEDILLQAKQQDKHIFIRFSASWCLPCQMLNDQLANHPEIVKDINEIYIGIELDYDDPNDLEWFVRYGIQCLPTMMVIDDMGKTIDKINGTGSIAGLESFLHLNAKYPTDKFDHKELSNIQSSKNIIHTKNTKQDSPKTVLIFSDFSIQFGAFSSFSNAQNLSNSLLAKENIGTIILEEYADGKALYKVRQISFMDDRAGNTYVKSYKQKGIECMLKKV